MAETVAIEASFPVPVSMSQDAYRLLVDALGAICDEYEEAHPDRVMWVAGMGGRPPPMWPWVDDGSTGDFDMSVEHFEIAERERYENEKPTKRGDSLLYWRDERHKLIWQVRDTYQRARKAEELLARLFQAAKPYNIGYEGSELLEAMCAARARLDELSPALPSSTEGGGE